MSYNISFKVRVADTDKYINVGDCDANTTWNVGEIIRLSTGLEWKNEANNGYCVDVIPKIQKGLNELSANSAAYKPYEPNNGWGTVHATKTFFQKIINDWNSYIQWTDPDIVAVTTFWVE